MHDAGKSRPKDEAMDSEATSKDTVKDLEADQIQRPSGADNESSPSPDGVLENDDAGADHDAGPM